MNNKNTLQKTEQQLMEELSIVKDPNVGKERKTKARRNIKTYEKYLRDNSDKEINGKEYPEQLCFCDDKPMDKEEVLKLIDSVDTPDYDWHDWDCDFNPKIDITGVSVGKDKFSYVDLGWNIPIHPCEKK